MTISEIISMLEEEMDEQGDCQLVIYDSNGNSIEPSHFTYGARSTSEGFVDTISFSSLQ